MKIKGSFIKQLRDALGLKRHQVSSMIGYSIYAIRSIEEDGNPRAEIELIVRLSILYNINVEDMIDMPAMYEEMNRIKMLNAKIPTIS